MTGRLVTMQAQYNIIHCEINIISLKVSMSSNARMHKIVSIVNTGNLVFAVLDLEF